MTFTSASPCSSSPRLLGFFSGFTKGATFGEIINSAAYCGGVHITLTVKSDVPFEKLKKGPNLLPCTESVTFEGEK